MFKELFKQLPWGLFAGMIVLNLALLAGATWLVVTIVKAVW